MTLYLHIGSQKTGTTTLQEAFYQNRDTLIQHGITYPEVEPDDENKVSHYNSVRGFFSDTAEDQSATERFVKRVNSINGDVLISAECLSSWPAKRADEDSAKYWRRKLSTLKVIRDAFEDKDVKVIFYIRDKLEFLKSLFNQHLKVSIHATRSLDGALANFLALEVIKTDYESQIEVWREVFGDVIVLEYEKYKSDGLIPSFMNALGRDIQLQEPERMNQSQDWAQLEARRVSVTFGCDVGDLCPERRKLFNTWTERFITDCIANRLNNSAV